MSEKTALTKDTVTIIIAVVMAAIAVVGINKADIAELRGLLIAHITSHTHHSHAGRVAVAEAEEK